VIFTFSTQFTRNFRTFFFYLFFIFHTFISLIFTYLDVGNLVVLPQKKKKSKTEETAKRIITGENKNIFHF